MISLKWRLREHGSALQHVSIGDGSLQGTFIAHLIWWIYLIRASYMNTQLCHALRNLVEQLWTSWHQVEIEIGDMLANIWKNGSDNCVIREHHVYHCNVHYEIMGDTAASWNKALAYYARSCNMKTYGAWHNSCKVSRYIEISPWRTTIQPHQLINKGQSWLFKGAI